MTELVKIQSLSAGYGRGDVIKDISLSFSGPGLAALMGPNGSGKTTLLRALLGMLKLSSGSIFLNGSELAKLGFKERAVLVSFIPQISSPVPGFTVEEIVSMGRYPHDAGISADRQAVDGSLQRMDLLRHRDADVSRISGGEYQRVLIARALAQETPVMLLDEPTSHLDIKYRHETMKILSSLKTEKLIIGVFHDIDLVKDRADRVILMKNGIVAAEGTAPLVLTAESIDRVFGIRTV